MDKPVEQDDPKLIEADDGSRWRLSNSPTQYLYVLFMLDFRDAETKVLREMALYLDTELVPDVPKGRSFIDIKQVRKPGHLLAMKRTPPIHRMGSRHSFGEIMTF